MTARKRVARDAGGERTRYEDIAIGEDLGSIEWSFDEAAIARICDSDDDFHEWYAVESPYGGIIAPVLIGYPPVRMLLSATSGSSASVNSCSMKPPVTTRRATRYSIRAGRMRSTT